MSTSVLIACDHVVVRRRLRALFESEADIDVIGEACDAPVTNLGIGTRLGISRRTAESHRPNLLRKLGLNGQPDLPRYALTRDLVER
jgi:DNA-binding NarL/FixJ family response regulator